MTSVNHLIQPMIDRSKTDISKAGEQVRGLIRNPQDALMRTQELMISLQGICARQTLLIEALLIEVDVLESRLEEHKHRS